MLRSILITVVVIQFCSVSTVAMDTDDEIDFFNVGQGHAVLIHQNGSDPLLIDAGSSRCHYELGQQHNWEKGNSESSIAKIANRIKDFWRRSNAQYHHLDVIVTHPDDDHKNFLLDIFRKLEDFLSSASVLLGGKKDMYKDFL